MVSCVSVRFACFHVYEYGHRASFDLFHIAVYGERNEIHIKTMVDTGGTRTLLYLHLSPSLYHCATDAILLLFDD